jgi:hypothetical protein
VVFGVDQPDQQGDEDLAQRRRREVDAEDARLLTAFVAAAERSAPLAHRGELKPAKI